MDGGELQRFSYAERLVHWLVGVTFVLLLLTGLALSYPSLFWLTAVVGGGTAARVLHPWIGLAFTAGLVAMFLLWLEDMFLDRNDLRWMGAVHHYARHRRDKVPPTGKYNGGQKVFFWSQSVLGVVFLVTGIPLWIPGFFGADLLVTMRLFHYLAALGGGLFLIVHVYLGWIAYPGTARGMVDGKVSRAWARHHHPLWYEEETE